jgi:hypothetical protein
MIALVVSSAKLNETTKVNASGGVRNANAVQMRISDIARKNTDLMQFFNLSSQHLVKLKCGLCKDDCGS